MVAPSDARTFSDSLVDESFDEAVFLWRRWEAELVSLTRNLDEIWAWTEDRLQGALDGVRIAGERLVEIAGGALLSDDLSRVTTSAAVLGSSDDTACARAIEQALQRASGPVLRAIMRGIELTGSGPAARAAVDALVARGAEGASELCRLKAFRRIPAGTELSLAFDSDVADARVNAMRATASLPQPQAQEWITAGLRHEDPGVRSAAVESGVARGFEPAWRSAQQSARQRSPDAGPYLKMLAMLGTPDDHEIVYAALRIPALQREAIWALGHIGTARAVEACLAGMQHAPLARACGEAYCCITGADLARDRLTIVEPAPAVPAFEDDDLDADLVPSPEALWPIPDVDAVRQHWQARQSAVDATVRYLGGVPASIETRLTAVERGPMLRRPDTVLELRARTRGRYDVETRAFTQRQRQMMAAGRAAMASNGG
jgi:uncharacterized protein (TIGR02270 family)